MVFYCMLIATALAILLVKCLSMDFAEVFDPEGYLKEIFPLPRELSADNGHSQFVLMSLAKHFSNVAQSQQRILDYGCGPSLPFDISAAAKASEIVLADYVPQNRDFWQKWVENDPAAYNWSPYFKYVVETLEGGSEEETVQRESDLRSKITAIVHCDMTKENFIDKNYMNERFDTVMTFCTLESCCTDVNGFKAALKKLSTLVKEGGHLLLISTRRENCDVGFYIVKGQKIASLILKRDDVVEAIQECGLKIVREDYAAIGNHFSNTEGYLFFAAQKN